MTPNDDPLFEALAGLPRIDPGAGYESRVRGRCHSAIANRATLLKRTSRNLSSAALAAISGAVILCAYLAVMFAQVLRLAKP
ncbi:MAG TPA: hypothetical protein VJO35_03545 [Terriglobales bacterium]|nr:hypothetical protein [Terriglobales bacterium]